MRPQYFQKTFNPFATPVQELIELNVRTIQHLSYLDPTELLNVHKPELLLEKNMDVLIKNSHTALDYMQDAFYIVEKHMLNLSDNVMKHTKETMDESEKMVRNRISEVVKGSQQTAKKVVSNAKNIAGSVKKATTAARKSVKSSASNKTAAKAAQTRKETAKKEGSNVRAMSNKAKSTAHKSVKPSTSNKTADNSASKEAAKQVSSGAGASSFQSKDLRNIGKEHHQGISTNQVTYGKEVRPDTEKKST